MTLSHLEIFTKMYIASRVFEHIVLLSIEEENMKKTYVCKLKKFINLEISIVFLSIMKIKNYLKYLKYS